MAQQTHIPCRCQLPAPQSSLCSYPTLRGTSGSQLAELVHSLAFLALLVTTLVLQTQIWHCLGAPSSGSPLPQSQSRPHSAAPSQCCSCYFTHIKYWQFSFLAGTLKLNLLFHCLNHWNEYTTQPCLREERIPVWGKQQPQSCANSDTLQRPRQWKQHSNKLPINPLN